ncbi:MAG: RecQ family ATP-dependent DNA helicase [Gemmatimonadota bacterium]
MREYQDSPGPADPLAQARRVLRDRFGHADFRAGQRRIVRASLANRDVLGVLPTGSGKSLCFQVPALVRPGLTVVVSPLISLMDDQVARLARAGVAAVAITSADPPALRRARLERLGRPDLRLLYASPERLLSAPVRARLRAARVGALAVDEAHCISEWGHDFRPCYRRIPELFPVVGRPPVLALTATATPRTAADIEACLRLRNPVLVRLPADRPNLRWEVVGAGSASAAVRVILSNLRRLPGSAIVYAQTRFRAVRAASVLRARGVSAEPYHAGMTAEARRAVQRAFFEGATRVVCATSAFGMGIDHGRVRAVFHLGMPGSLEAYVQEAGRAGRDGAPARCLLIALPDDGRLHRSRLRARRGSGSSPAAARARLAAMRRYVETRSCRRAAIAIHFGQDPPECAGCDRCVRS